MAELLSGFLRRPLMRRAVTVPAVTAGAAALAATAPVWAPLSAAVDAARGRSQLPSLRVFSFALGWTVLETVGVGATTALWAAGRSEDVEAHVALQRWWADRLIGVLQHTAGLTIETDDLELLSPGPIILCSRHASIPDALVPMWLLGQAGMRPRYVMKDDLQLDPCLDIVGNRLPNHFIDRDPGDSGAELAALEALSSDMGPLDAGIIFPEGGVVTAASRERTIASALKRDPSRGDAVADLAVLGPARPGGTAALLRGAPDADLVFAVHTGLEAVQRLADAPLQVPLDQPVRVRLRRVARADVPTGDRFPGWLDQQWAELDRTLASLPATGDAAPSATDDPGSTTER